MTEPKEPTYAPGHELTLHPGDPVRGADVLEAAVEQRGQEDPDRPDPDRPEKRTRTLF